MNGKHQIFISYASADYLDQNKQTIPNNIIGIIRQLLTDHNIDYWWDEKILGGHEYAKDIIAAIDSSYIYLVVLTENSISSEWVELEIRRARKKGKKIIPVLTISEDKIPDHIDFFISHLEYIDYTNSIEEANSKLIQSIEGLLQDQSFQKELESYNERIRYYDEVLKRYQLYREKLVAELAELSEKQQSINLEIRMREDSIELLKDKEQQINIDKKDIQSLIDESHLRITRVQSQKDSVPLDPENYLIDLSAQVEDGESLKSNTKDIDLDQGEQLEKPIDVTIPISSKQEEGTNGKIDYPKNGFASLMGYYKKPKIDR